MAKRYRRDDGLCVIWDSRLCIQCDACWRGLRQVFDLGRQPWVNIHGASTEAILEQVKKCPSGALTATKEA